jgi:hypothetical protein
VSGCARRLPPHSREVLISRREPQADDQRKNNGLTNLYRAVYSGSLAPVHARRRSELLKKRLAFDEAYR